MTLPFNAVATMVTAATAIAASAAAFTAAATTEADAATVAPSAVSPILFDLISYLRISMVLFQAVAAASAINTTALAAATGIVAASDPWVDTAAPQSCILINSTMKVTFVILQSQNLKILMSCLKHFEILLL